MGLPTGQGTRSWILPKTCKNHPHNENRSLQQSARKLTASLWNSCEKTFFDIRITHPTSQSYSGKSLAEVYQQQKKEKKDKYNQRVIDIEKSSFKSIPLSSQQQEGLHQNATE